MAHVCVLHISELLMLHMGLYLPLLRGAVAALLATSVLLSVQRVAAA